MFFPILSSADEMAELSREFSNTECVAANERMALTAAFDVNCVSNSFAGDLGPLVDELR